AADMPARQGIFGLVDLQPSGRLVQAGLFALQYQLGRGDPHLAAEFPGIKALKPAGGLAAYNTILLLQYHVALQLEITVFVAGGLVALGFGQIAGQGRNGRKTVSAAAESRQRLLFCCAELVTLVPAPWRRGQV